MWNGTALILKAQAGEDEDDAEQFAGRNAVAERAGDAAELGGAAEAVEQEMP
jgi:hypothetical protein